MKRFKLHQNTRRYMKLVAVSFILLFSFNNCEQNGKIALKKVASSDGIQSNPPDQPPVVTYVDKLKNLSITAGSSTKVDILIVIDNSGSMKYEQSNMAMRFNSFIDQLNGLDWQLGIVTTDVSSDANLKDGRLISYPNDSSQFILSSTMDLNLVKSHFASMIQRSETGSANEQGIKATYRTLERALDASALAVNVPNKALVRADAALAVLVVTDANETSPSLEIRNDPNKLNDFIRANYPEKKFSFNSIIVQSGDNACLGNKTNNNEGFGISYEALSMATGGAMGSVCASDYAAQLTNIGQGVSLLVTSIQLDCTPVDADKEGNLDILVQRTYLDSMNVPKTEVVYGYTVNGNQLRASAGFPVGNYSVAYKCIQ